MNAPFLYCYAPLLARRLAGAEVRYVLREKGDPPPRVYLIRLGGGGEGGNPGGGGGTLVVSLERELPAVAHLAEGEAPPGIKTADAAALKELLARRRGAGASVEPVDRAIALEWPPLTLRVSLIPGRTSLVVVEGGETRLRLPREGPDRGGSRPVAGGKPDLLRYDPDGPGALPAAGTDEEEVRAAIRRSVLSAPPEWIDELLHRAAGRGGDFRGAWRELVEELRASREAGGPAGLYRRRGDAILSPVALRHLEPGREFGRHDEAAAEFWRLRHGERALREAVTGLQREVRAERKRLERLRDRLEKDRDEARKAPLHRRKGEILSIHFQEIRKGATSIRLPDPYEGGEIEIELDPSKGAKHNVDRYFRRGARGDRALPRIEERLAGVRRKLEALGDVESGAARAGTADEAERLKQEARQHFRPERAEPAWRKRIKKPSDRKSGARPREYTVAGGYTVLAGRDNRENDQLTFKIAGQRDIWFHAGQSSGSHVVLLKNDPKENPPKEALLAAAAIAAWHSKSRHGGKVPVIYTERRFVRKPRGAPPGTVTCTREKTLFVDPGLPEGGGGEG